MLKLVIISSNKENTKEYKELIDILLLKTKDAYKTYCFNGYSNELKDFIKNNDELIYIIEHSNDINCEQLLQKLRVEKLDMRSFVIIIDFMNQVNDIVKNKYFVNNKILSDKDNFKKDFQGLIEVLFLSYKGKKNILKFIYNNCIYRISFSDILYIEKERNSKKIEIVCKDNSIYKISKPLNEISNMLDHRFFKVHRSATVNLYNIKNIDFKNNIITFVNGDNLDLISRDKIHELKDIYSKQDKNHTFNV